MKKKFSVIRILSDQGGIGIFSETKVQEDITNIARKIKEEKFSPLLQKSQKRIICLWRAFFWSKVLALLTRGIKITLPNSKSLVSPDKTKLPDGPLILVANHSSHMDSAVLASVIGAKRSLSFVAGADYWTSSKFKSWIGRNLAGLFLVRRGGDGWNDLLSSAEALNNGTILVIYPEGTRTRTGEIGRFHTGAFRLAVESNARILPVALIGCREALPVHGKFSRQKIVIRIGEPISVNEATIAEASLEAREVIINMLNEKDNLK